MPEFPNFHWLRTKIGKLRKTIKKFFKSRKKYEFIAADITNNCNLRCPFCINDFSKIQKKDFMTEETYERILRLLPLVEEGQFFISCLYEPAIHPHFTEFLEKIPKKHRKKVFFTTNLAIKIPDEEIQQLSHASLHHINISIDSFHPAVFEKLRRGAKFDRFIDNLERIVSAFSRSRFAPPLRYTTMVLKANLNEIPSVVEECAKRYQATMHELRYIYEVPHLSTEWKQKNLISNEEWAELEEYVKECPHNCDIVAPPPNYYADDKQHYSRGPKAPENLAGSSPSNILPLGLRISSDGIVSLYGRDVHFDINELESPNKFFKRLISSFQLFNPKSLHSKVRLEG